MSDELTVRATVHRLLKLGGDIYSVEVLDAWRENPYPMRRTALSYVNKTLRLMETRGELTSALLMPAEHGGSQLARRYYRRATTMLGEGTGDEHG